jgi:hypothetical protein
MNAVWPITALYLGPIALWWYLTLGRGSSHNRPFWKSIIVEATHRGAGCTLDATRDGDRLFNILHGQLVPRASRNQGSYVTMEIQHATHSR